MADAITIKALQDASLDAKTLEEVVNGDDAKQVTTRLGETYPSVKKAIRTMFDNGGLPAEPFATKALMTASALVDGSYAMVTDDPANNGLYVKTAGTWVKSEYDPLTMSKEYVDAATEFKTTAEIDDMAFAIVDESGGAGLILEQDGTLVVDSASIDGNEVYDQKKTDIALIVTGVDDGAGLILDSRGYLTVKGLITDSINGAAYSPQQPNEVPKNKVSGYTAEVNGICSYGQSLGMGSTSTPVVSTTQDYDNLMFNSGVRTYDKGSDPLVIYASLVPMVESQEGTYGETPISGMSDNIKNLMLIEDNLTYTDTNYKILGSAPAQGGTPIAGLVKGTTFYNRLKDHIKYGALRSKEINQYYAYQATTWLQGEADYSGSTPKNEYKYVLSKLVDDIANDAYLETGQSFKPEFIIGQVGSHLRYAQSVGILSAFKGDIAQAQLELSTERDDIHLACPSYFFDYSGNGVSQVHLTAADERLMGAYFGLVYKRVVIDGSQWRPLQPTAISHNKKAVYITLNVPKPPLVIDTTWVLENKDYGFRVFDDGVQVAITSVTIVNGSSIKLLLANDILGVMSLDYALKSDSLTGETGRKIGARGNIRDSQGDTLVFDPTGVNRPLHNWLIMFNYKDGEGSWL